MAKDPNIIILKHIRLSFPFLVTPRYQKDPRTKAIIPESGKFSAALVLHKEDDKEMLDKVKAHYERIRTDPSSWKDGKIPTIEKLLRGKYYSFHEGSDIEDMEGFNEDVMYISASRREADGAPVCQNENGEDLSPNQIKRVLYGGCYVDTSLRMWPMDNEYGKGILCELRVLRFNEDGEPFGASRPSGDELDDEEDDMPAKTKPKPKAKPAGDWDF